MTFDPFPLALLEEVAAPVPGLQGWGFELLPFLRWLKAHAAWSRVAYVDDGNGLWAPVLPHAVPGDHGIACVRLDGSGDAPPGLFDFIHVTAELPPDRLATFLARLGGHMAEGGLLLLHQPYADGLDIGAAATLPIGEGVHLLQPAGPATPLMAWLGERPAADIDHLGRFFDGLGQGIAAQATAPAVVHDGAGLFRQTSEASLRQRLDHLEGVDRHLRSVIADRIVERDAAYASLSWRLTAPLRRAEAAIRRARTAAAAPSPEVHQVPAPDTFAAFLATGGRLALPGARRPAVSVLLAAEGGAAALHACLSALASCALPDGLEVVMSAQGCSGQTAQLLDRLDGALVVPGEAGLAGALRAARGEAVLLLDSRIRVSPGAVAALLGTLRASPGAGAVGGKIIGPAGAVVQAGEAWDAAGMLHSHGAGLPVTAPEVQYRRVAQSCSALMLLVRARLMRQLGGISPGFAGTAHAGADLCRRLLGAGWQTMYEPLAEASFAGAASPDAAGLFSVRHAALAAPTACDPPAQVARARKRLLIIDDRVPYPALGAGYPRAARMIHELHRLGWQITVYPNHEPHDDWGSIYRQFPREVEFMLGYGRSALGHFLHQRPGTYDAVLVSRPHNMRDYLAARADTPLPRELVYDAEAVFATREFLRLEQAGRSPEPAQRRAMLQEEMALTATAAVVTAVNEAEAALFREAGCPRVVVLGLGTEAAPVSNAFARRRDLLFVGALGEDTSPNADAVRWFVQEVMPLLDRHIGDGYRLLVAGRCRAPGVLALAGERVRILGLVDDLVPLYAAARAFVAPTRYAAGLPLKVQEAVGRGLPVVGTHLLARQLGWTPGQEMLAASTAEGFAEACARLYTDPALWYALRRQGLARLVEEQRQNDFAAILEHVVGRGG